MEKKNITNIKPFNIILGKKRLPSLFIGSGFSKRYIENYPNWIELLDNIAEIIGLNSAIIHSMKANLLSQGYTEGQANQKIGSYLKTEFENNLKENIKLFNNDELSFSKKENISLFKILLAKMFKSETLNLKKESYLNTELTIFKELVEKVKCIFTTNYDVFIEYLAGDKITPIIHESDYFYSSFTSAELYKIHGSILAPSTLVFTEEDYINFDQRRLTVAKLLTVVAESPIIFIGYSLEDENIRKLLDDLVKCLTIKQIDDLKNNLILIDFKKCNKDFEVGTMVIPFGIKTLSITTVKTDNYTLVYRLLNKFAPYATPQEIRKYKSLLKNLIDGNDKKITTVLECVSSFENRESDEVAVALGSEIESPNKYPAKNIIIDVLKRENRYTPDQIYQWTLTHFNPTHWIPLFYYKFTKEQNDSEKIKCFKSKKRKDFKAMNFDKVLVTKTNAVAQIEKELKKSLKPLDKCLLLMYNYLELRLTKDEFRNLLIKLYEEDNKILNETAFKKAVTLIDYL